MSNRQSLGPRLSSFRNSSGNNDILYGFRQLMVEIIQLCFFLDFGGENIQIEKNTVLHFQNGVLFDIKRVKMTHFISIMIKF